MGELRREKRVEKTRRDTLREKENEEKKKGDKIR